MRHQLLSSSIAMAPSSSLSLSKPLKKPSNSLRSNPNVNSQNCPSSAAGAGGHYLCKHSPFFFVVFLSAVIAFEICCGNRSRKCGKSGCKGLRKAMEFDLQVQDEECLKVGSESKAVREIDELPWKGGSETNLDYECLRAELRKMAPPNGRAVLLFRAKCGCPIAKLEGWGPKRGRRHKK
nr:uncharacterized protein At5g19025 [Ipomoea trifida]